MLLTKLGGSTYATSRHAGGTLRWTAPELLDLQVPEDEENPLDVFRHRKATCIRSADHVAGLSHHRTVLFSCIDRI
jgi:hypothetical protein